MKKNNLSQHSSCDRLVVKIGKIQGTLGVNYSGPCGRISKFLHFQDRTNVADIKVYKTFGENFSFTIPETNFLFSGIFRKITSS